MCHLTKEARVRNCDKENIQFALEVTIYSSWFYYYVTHYPQV